MKRVFELLGLLLVSVLIYGFMLFTDYASPWFPTVIFIHACIVSHLTNVRFKTFNVGFLVFGGVILTGIAVTIDNPALLCLVVIDLLYTVLALIHKDNFEDENILHRRTITRR